MLKASNYQEFMEGLKTKRYTWTRLQRACTHLLTNTTKTVMKDLQLEKKASYIRILGISETGQAFLQQNKKDIDLPLISKLSSFSNEYLQLDIKAAYTYAMVLKGTAQSEFMHSEYSTPPIRFNRNSGEFNA